MSMRILVVPTSGISAEEAGAAFGRRRGRSMMSKAELDRAVDGKK